MIVLARTKKTVIADVVIVVRYHCGGWSEEVNSGIFFLSYTV
jgi:hypothetical protein